MGISCKHIRTIRMSAGVLCLLLACVDVSKGMENTKSVWLSSLDLQCVQQSWGRAQADRALDGHVLSVGGRVFARGLATHAHSTLYVELGGNCERLTALVGVEDALGDNQTGTVMFTVIADGRRLWDSGVRRAGQPAVAVDLDLRGVQMLGLLAGSADDGIDWDHAVWADACLHMLARASPQAVFPPPADREVEMLAAAQIRASGLFAGARAEHSWGKTVPERRPGRGSRLDLSLRCLDVSDAWPRCDFALRGPQADRAMQQ